MAFSIAFGTVFGAVRGDGLESLESGGPVAAWVSDLGGALEVGGCWVGTELGAGGDSSVVWIVGGRSGSCRGGGRVVGGGWDLFALSMLSIFSDSFCSTISIFLILESSSILFSSMLALISVMSFLRKLMEF